MMKELFRSAYGMDIDQEKFIKRYDTKALGHEVIGFLAIHKTTNSIAAYYGVFPLTILVNGQTLLAAQSGDTMTHENHRRKGLFVLLAKKTMDECKRKGIRLVFGQPNVNSYHGFIHSLKFFHVDNIIRYDLKRRVRIPPFPKWMQRTGSFPLFLKYARKILQPFIEREVQEFTNTLPASMGKVWRNSAYLSYKKEDSKFFLRVNDVVLWVKLEDVFIIGDISDYSQMNENVLHMIKKMAYRLGYNTISFYLNKSADNPAFLEKFETRGSEPSCCFYLDENYAGLNLLLTAADFDTW